MLGAIIGDMAGSIYEYGQIKGVSSIEPKNIIEDNSFYSDDTILTMAIADAILSGEDYGEKLREYALKYKSFHPTDLPYFKTVFSPNFEKWAKGNEQGESRGNGAMMRVSPVGYLFNNERDVERNAILSTIPSHNSDEAIDCARIVALVILYARLGYTKDEIAKKLHLQISKPNITKFNYTCADTIGVCMYSLYHGKNFEECIRIALSFGGDTDTNACIVGSMAEAMYGIGEDLKKQALAKLPPEFVDILQRSYSKIEGIHEPTISD